MAFKMKGYSYPGSSPMTSKEKWVKKIKEGHDVYKGMAKDASKVMAAGMLKGAAGAVVEQGKLRNEREGQTAGGKAWTTGAGMGTGEETKKMMKTRKKRFTKTSQQKLEEKRKLDYNPQSKRNK